MKISAGTVILTALLPVVSIAEEAPAADAQAKHREAASKVADLQDELSADVQQLGIEQTNPKVRELLTRVEEIMDEVTDGLAEADTGGKTLAAQTEVIEKIHEAAKEKRKEGGGQSGSAMMDMMERMMGKNKEPAPGKSKNGQASDTGSYGLNGLSDEANGSSEGAADGAKTEVRKVPKAGGTAGHALPEEFRKALDAYNRGAEKKVK